MPATKPVLAACAAVALGYLAYPYVTLYQLGEAIHQGDARTLQQLVNWPSVREGIKEDICDGLAGGQDEAKNDLPGFGSSFMRGIATNAVDQRVTPQSLLAAVRAPEQAPPKAPEMHISWAFFDSPTQFTVSVNALGQAQPIRLQLELKDAQWQVTRVWLPPDMLGQAKARI